MIEAVVTKGSMADQEAGNEMVLSWLHQHDTLLSQTSLLGEERFAVALFVTMLCERFPDLIETIILYGSAARGDVRRDSDVDLLILTTQEIDGAAEAALRDIAHASEWEHSCVLSILIFPPSKQEWHRRGSSFWLNVQTDGLTLYSASEQPLLNRNAWSSRFTPERGYQITDAQYDEIRIHMEHAADDLEIAELLINSWKERAAIGHCYYAVFYAASALLLTKGIVQAHHSGVRSQLSLHFFKSKILPPEWSTLYQTLQEERESATYNIEYEPGEAIAAQRLQWAEEFVDTARRYLIENKFLMESGV